VATRVDSLDVARGTAMLFVCLSHFAATFLAPWGNPSLSSALQWSGAMAGTISMIATPSFVSVSGIVVGYLYRCNPAMMPGLRRKLLDRGLFLLLIGHLLQAFPAYLQFRDASRALRFEMITDVIGVAILIGPSLLLWLSTRGRMVVGAALLVLSWCIAYLSPPHNTFAVIVVRYAFGHPGDPASAGFPFVPWLGVYVLATVLGERMGTHAEASRPRRGDRLLLRVGGLALCIAITVTAARHVLRALAPAFINAHNALSEFLALGRKFPPGPVYLLFFAGAGLILIAKAFSVARDEAWASLTRPLGAIGRASFFVFVLQGYVYYMGVPALNLPYPQLWPVYYAASILFFLAAAALWNSLDGNRFLTVGLWRTVPIVRAMRSRVRTTLAAR
jgi:predicted acyltransferase